MERKRIAATILTALLTMAAVQGRAAEGPYESGLLRLAEILGSLHFLRNLCGDEGDKWRGEMEKLLASENPDAERRAQFIANFNRGYRSLQANYTTCTASATEAISRYIKEGEQLSKEIAVRFGN